MNCSACGASVPPDAKFCAQCAAPVGAQAPHTSRAMPRAAERRPARGSFGDFTHTLLPVVRAPRVVGNLLAAAVALAISVAVSIVLWLLFTTVLDTRTELLLPPFLEPSQDVLGVLSVLTFVLHQVPLHAEGDLYAHAPLLLVLVPVLACALGLRLARRAVPRSGTGGFLRRTAPFAGCYALLLLLWSLPSANDWHGGRLGAIIAGILLAVTGSLLHDRLFGRTAAAEEDTTRVIDPVPSRPTEGRRFRRALRTAARVFVGMVAVGAVGMLVVAATRAIDDGEDTGTRIASAVLQVVEGGFEAVGWGVGTEGAPEGAELDEGLRLPELGDVLETAPFVLLLVTALGVVLLGGLYSGFAIARVTDPRSTREHALLGALTGVVWAVAMLAAHLVVLTRLGDDDETYTLFDGGELFLLSLVVGGLLGALGGILAATTDHDLPLELGPGPATPDPRASTHGP